MAASDRIAAAIGRAVGVVAARIGLGDAVLRHSMRILRRLKPDSPVIVLAEAKMRARTDTKGADDDGRC